MRLDILGSSGTAPTATNPASGYLVRSEATTIWMDAGPGTFMALLGMVEPEELDAVLLSHLHPDHSTDLFALFHELVYVRKTPTTVPVVAPDGAIERVGGFLGGTSDHALFEALPFRQCDPGDAMVFGDIVVTAQAAHHSVPAFAYRLESAGASLGYTGDTGPSEMLREHFTGVGTLLAEASLQDGGEPYGFHMSARQAGELATYSGTGHLVLTHIPSSLDPAVSRREASEVFAGPLSLAAPGDTFMIEATE